MIRTPLFDAPVLAGSTAVLLSLAIALPVLASGTLPTHRLSADLANRAVVAAVAHCAAEGYFESAVVVDISGVDQAALRGDGAGVHTPESAYDKAYTSVSLGVDTQMLYDAQRSKISPDGPFSKVPHLVLFGGGVVVKQGTETIGGIGAAGAPGGKLDEACAQAGLDAIKSHLTE